MADMEVDQDTNVGEEKKKGKKPAKQFEIKKWNAVAMWSWAITSDTCAICRNNLYEPSIEYQSNPTGDPDHPGRSIAWGTCGHVFHLDDIQKWLKTRSACPLCSKEWEYTKIEKIQSDVIGGAEFLVYGKTGWIGGLLGDLLKEQGLPFEYGESRLEDRRGILEDIERVKPTHVLNAAGVTGRPNVDWCEDHRPETIKANVVGVVNLADVCAQKGLHMTNYATGCIYEYDEAHKEHSGVGFTENDPPNFTKSYYAFSKVTAEKLLHPHFPNVLTLRIRAPIVTDLSQPRSFVAKIIRYTKVINIQNSLTVLPEMLPMSIELAKRGRTGIYNFTNIGTCSHNDVLQLYKDYCDPNFTWSNFTVEEQNASVLKAPRSNLEMDVSKLRAEFPELLTLRESLIKYVFEPNKGKPIAK